jgi:hypothetical protein
VVASGAGPVASVAASRSVSFGSADAFSGNMRAFLTGLGVAYVEGGRNVLIEYHWLKVHRDDTRPFIAC